MKFTLHIPISFHMASRKESRGDSFNSCVHKLYPLHPSLPINANSRSSAACKYLIRLRLFTGVADCGQHDSALFRVLYKENHWDGPCTIRTPSALVRDWPCCRISIKAGLLDDGVTEGRAWALTCYTEHELPQMFPSSAQSCARPTGRQSLMWPSSQAPGFPWILTCRVTLLLLRHEHPVPENPPITTPLKGPGRRT